MHAISIYATKTEDKTKDVFIPGQIWGRENVANKVNDLTEILVQTRQGGLN